MELTRPVLLPGRTPRSIATVVVLGGIRAYRLLFSSRPSPCRFEPTCSLYGLEAVETHGAVRGLLLTARRIGRCRPGGGQGYDPVPSRTSESSSDVLADALATDPLHVESSLPSSPSSTD
jgi:uncharacterized protein